MSPSVAAIRSRRKRAALLCAALLGGAASAVALVSGCLEGGRHGPPRHVGEYPPPPQVPRVVALGTLRGAPAPTAAETNLALFLFGEEPPAPLTIANALGMRARQGLLLICDPATDTIWRWDASSGQITREHDSPPVVHPVAVDIAANGDRILCDAKGIRRIRPDGSLVCTYGLDSGELRPGGVLEVDDTVWVTNLPAHSIEVFDGTSGRHLRTIGAHGSGPGQFALPRGLARTADGHVCVVDMLNCRVQVLDHEGHWVRDIGEPGDNPGAFGRPRDVAVGPDGTVFVTDAFSQRVQAFSAEGQPLLAFGEPGSGIGELTLPAGIAVTASAPETERKLPAGLSPMYYVLVAEQINHPGVRIYAWLGAQQPEGAVALAPEAAATWRPKFPGSGAINPHWNPQRCTKCHEEKSGRMLTIAPEAVDPLCLSCHDGAQAPADPHPVGRHADTELVTTPSGWPTVEGTIGCLTCHDIQRHCRIDARRPAVNAVLLRHYDPQRPLEYCSNCHKSDVGGRFSPHRQRDSTGKIREDACLFCHTQRPEVPADGRRRFQPHLRVESSQLCLRCHVRHWDLSPLGHVDRPVPPRILRWMLFREDGENAYAPGPHTATPPKAHRQPALFPLGDGKVTCYTCHNPHYNGLFPPNSELGALATNPQERRSALRANWIDLCLNCHEK